jgi:hypothetical protein
MAFNLDKAIAGMSFAFPSVEQIEETMGILLSYPATPEGHAMLSVYTYDLQMSWPRLYIEALLRLQHNAFLEEAAKTDSIHRQKKRKYDKKYREAINVKKVIDGRRDQMLGFDKKGRVRLVGMVHRRIHGEFVSGMQFHPEVSSGSMAASSSVQLGSIISSTASLPMKTEDSVAEQFPNEVAAGTLNAPLVINCDDSSSD